MKNRSGDEANDGPYRTLASFPGSFLAAAIYLSSYCLQNSENTMFVIHNQYLVDSTVEREIFTLKIICVKIFCVDKFSRFRSILEHKMFHSHVKFSRLIGHNRKISQILTVKFSQYYCQSSTVLRNCHCCCVGL